MTNLAPRLHWRPTAINVSVVGAAVLISALIGLSWMALTWIE
jgi:hypothetical protein